MINYFGLSSGRGSAWLERLVRDQEVGGSNPLAPIFLNPTVAAVSKNLLNGPTHSKVNNLKINKRNFGGERTCPNATVFDL